MRQCGRKFIVRVCDVGKQNSAGMTPVGVQLDRFVFKIKVQHVTFKIFRKKVLFKSFVKSRSYY